MRARTITRCLLGALCVAALSLSVATPASAAPTRPPPPDGQVVTASAGYLVWYYYPTGMDLVDQTGSAWPVSETADHLHYQTNMYISKRTACRPNVNCAYIVADKAYGRDGLRVHPAWTWNGNRATKVTVHLNLNYAWDQPLRDIGACAAMATAAGLDYWRTVNQSPSCKNAEPWRDGTPDVMNPADDYYINNQLWNTNGHPR